MPVYVNRAHVYTLTTGTGTITLGTVVPGFQSFASAGVADTNVVSYTIEDTGNAWEVGIGTYSSTGPTLTRTLVQSSTGSLLNLTGSARVYVIQSADNMTNLSLGNGSASAPSVSFNGDPDTGVFNAGANIIGFSAGGGEKMRINGSGDVLINIATAQAFLSTTGASITPRLQNHGTSTGGAAFANAIWSANSNGANYWFGKSRGAAIGTFGIATVGDNIGTILFNADDGAAFQPSAAIRSEVDGTPATGSMPGRLVFMTTATGGATPSERFRIGPTGELGIGGANFGTSGQVLTSGGSGAAPVWANGGAYTLLGTITTTSGTTQTLSGLSLTGYRQLALVYNGVSHNAGVNTAMFVAGIQMSNATRPSTSLFYGSVTIWLDTGFMQGSLEGSANLPQTTLGQAAGMSGYTTATTSISVSAGGTASFDAGSILVYGVK